MRNDSQLLKALFKGNVWSFDLRVLVEDDQLCVKDSVQVEQDAGRPQETGHHRHLPLHHPPPPHRPLHPPLLQIHKLLPGRHRIMNHFFLNYDLHFFQ